MEYIIGILILIGGGFLVALGLKRRPVVVENKSKVEQAKLDAVKKEREKLEKDLQDELEEANEKASNAPAPTIDELRAELERIRARRKRRERHLRSREGSE